MPEDDPQPPTTLTTTHRAQSDVPATSAENTWGDLISEKRQGELQDILDAWKAPGADHGERRGPFDGVRLTGADVSWLAEQVRDENGFVPDLHLEGADLRRAQLNKANLSLAQLKWANLSEAYLEGANLYAARLEEADLIEARLNEAALVLAHLDGAALRWAWLDSKSALNDAKLDTKTSLGDIQWSGVGAVNLSGIHWDAVSTLGDEQSVGIRSSARAHEAAVRAYRQLAAQLRVQGMSEVADRFADRAQVRQRKLLFRRMLEDWKHPWLIPIDLVRWHKHYRRPPSPFALSRHSSRVGGGVPSLVLPACRSSSLLVYRRAGPCQPVLTSAPVCYRAVQHAST